MDESRELTKNCSKMLLCIVKKLNSQNIVGSQFVFSLGTDKNEPGKKITKETEEPSFKSQMYNPGEMPANWNDIHDSSRLSVSSELVSLGGLVYSLYGYGSAQRLDEQPRRLNQNVHVLDTEKGAPCKL